MKRTRHLHLSLTALTMIRSLWTVTWQTCCSREKAELKEVHIFSDGTASQFKNKFIFKLLCVLKEKLQLDLMWHFFATSHGKGAVDGIGGSIKRKALNMVKARRATITNLCSILCLCYKRHWENKSHAHVIGANHQDLWRQQVDSCVGKCTSTSMQEEATCQNCKWRQETSSKLEETRSRRLMMGMTTDCVAVRVKGASKKASIRPIVCCKGRLQARGTVWCFILW